MPLENYFEKAIIDKLKANDSELKNLQLILDGATPQIGSSGMDRLKCGVISHTDIRITDNLLSQLAEALQINTTLEFFCIRANGLSDPSSFFQLSEGVKAIGNAIKNHASLKKLVVGMSSSRRYEKETLEFMEALTGTANITELTIDIDCNDGLSLRELGNKLNQNSSLKSVTIFNFCDDGMVGYENAMLTTFIQGITQNKQLEVLSIDNLNIGCEGVRLLNEFLSKEYSLKYLRLERCGISGDAADALQDILTKNPELQNIELSHNPLGEQGIQKISDALPTLTKLVHLTLADTNLTSGSFVYLVNIWRIHQLKISALDVNYSSIDDQFIQAVIKLIDKNSFLDFLSLLFCGINDSHMASLSPLLLDKQRCQLSSIIFGENHESFSLKTFQTLLNILVENENICQLYMQSPLPDSKIIHAVEMLQTQENINQKKRIKKIRESQRLFVTTASILCQSYYTSYAPNSNNHNLLSILPPDVIMMIMLELGKGTLGMNAENIYLCSKLILYNFSKRRQLMNSSANTLQNGQITSWWSQSINDRGKDIKIFRETSAEIQIPKQNQTVLPVQMKNQKCSIM